MKVEEIREKFINGEKVFCDVCRNEIIVSGNPVTGHIVFAECSKDARHYSMISNSGARISEMFSDIPKQKAA